MKSKLLAQITIEKSNYSIRATEHSLKRMEQRKIDRYVVSGNILALGKEKLLSLQEEQEEFVVVDEEKNISIVSGFKKNTLRIITVIDKSKIWVKKGTSIINL